MKKNEVFFLKVKRFTPFGKILKIMKVLTFVMFVLVLQVSARSYSQNTKMSLNLQNTSIKQVLSNIEDQSEYRFLYSDSKINVERKVTVEFTNASVEDIIKNIFENSDIEYKIVGRQILLSPTVGSLPATQQQKSVSGKVTDSSRSPLPGVTVVVKGTTIGTITDANGVYSFSNVPANAILQFSFVGMNSKEIPVSGKKTIDATMEETPIGIDEVVVVGYGTQKKSDITGSVASVSKEKLEKLPTVNIAQAIQGAVAGVSIQTSASGAEPDMNIMIRGRNSIRASTNPLIVVDGIPYGGNLGDLNPNDIKSLEVLKDASAAAIYGSRGSNGVILITTKGGTSEKVIINYDGYYSMQDYSNLPDIMDGGQFYQFKKTRWPKAMTVSEEAIYQAGQDKWMNWLDSGLRNGHSQQHNISASGSLKNNTNYYISGGVTDVKGLTVNNDYLRLTNRINVDTKIAGWLTLGTRTQLTYDNKNGVSPTMENLFWMNPLTSSLDENGHYLIYPWPEDPFFEHPLAPTLYDNIDESYQIISQNYAVVDFPFIKGLSYRLNTGIRLQFANDATYRGRNTKVGYEAGGTSNTDNTKYNNTRY